MTSLAGRSFTACPRSCLGNRHGRVLCSVPLGPHPDGPIAPLLIGAHLVFVSLRARPRRGVRRRTAPSSRIELLVDADTFSVEMIRSAIIRLNQDRYQVHTTLFVEPGRLENKMWAAFMKEPGIRFQTIPRHSVAIGSEPNDEAIVHAMQELSRLPDVHGLALLTGDTDFVAPISKLQDMGTRIQVLVEARKFGTVSAYKSAGVEVLPLELLRKRRSKVLAVLHPDGTGSVKLDSTLQHLPYDRFVIQEQTIMKLMRKLGYRQEAGGFLHHECAKFCFANQLGPLTVFPHQVSVACVHDLVNQCAGNKSWEDNADNCAFLLPFTKPTRTSRKMNTYGSSQNRAVFEGGGPFILKDSLELTAQALMKLGFLDNELNADFSEAMFVFVNLSEHKKGLRKLGLLPDPDDKSTDVDEKLHAAFLSTKSAGQWRMLKNQTETIKSLVQTLKQVNVLPRASDSVYSVEEIYEAMKAYAEHCQLPFMRTFNGLHFRILRHIERRDPSMRKEVDFDR